MKKLLLSAVVLSVLGGAATNVMALEVGRNSPYEGSEVQPCEKPR